MCQTISVMEKRREDSSRIKIVCVSSMILLRKIGSANFRRVRVITVELVTPGMTMTLTANIDPTTGTALKDTVIGTHGTATTTVNGIHATAVSSATGSLNSVSLKFLKKSLLSVT